MQNNIKFLLLTFVFSALIPGSVSAMAISPSKIEIKNILPNQKIQRSISIYANNASDGFVYEMKKIGKDQDLLEFTTTTFVIPEGKRMVELPFYIDTTGVSTGEYSPQFSIISKKTFKQSSNVAVRAALTVKLSLSVTTTAVRDLELKNFSSKAVKVGDSPSLDLYAVNNGNKEVIIKNIKFILMDRNQFVLKTSEIDLNERIEMFNDRILKIDLKNKLNEAGQYFGKAEFRLEDGSIIASPKFSIKASTANDLKKIEKLKEKGSKTYKFWQLNFWKNLFASFN